MEQDEVDRGAEVRAKLKRGAALAGAGLATAGRKVGEVSAAGASKANASRQASSPDGHPVLFGVLALVGVSLAVGLILGAATLFGTRTLGLGDSGDGGAVVVAEEQESLFLPDPVPTETPSGPLVSLAPVPNEDAEDDDPRPSETAPATPISLTVLQSEVEPMGQIDLSGIYPGGEGAILQVQQFQNGEWEDFPVTVSVSGETFTTFVQTGQVGDNRFRVRDTDSDLVSNEIRVEVFDGQDAAAG